LLEPSALVEEGIIVINDFSKEGKYLNRSYVQEGRMRFYAGVPLVNKAGSVVGAVCVFDREARDGLSQDDKTYLKDLAGVVMDYLETYTIRERYRRAAKGL
jgi:GAF domain-containing protein